MMDLSEQNGNYYESSNYQRNYESPDHVYPTLNLKRKYEEEGEAQTSQTVRENPQYSPENLQSNSQHSQSGPENLQFSHENVQLKRENEPIKNENLQFVEENLQLGRENLQLKQEPEPSKNETTTNIEKPKSSGLPETKTPLYSAKYSSRMQDENMSYIPQAEHSVLFIENLKQQQQQQQQQQHQHQHQQLPDQNRTNLGTGPYL